MAPKKFRVALTENQLKDLAHHLERAIVDYQLGISQLDSQKARGFGDGGWVRIRILEQIDECKALAELFENAYLKTQR